MEMEVLEFDLALTLDSGQTFHWERAGGGFVGLIGDRAVYLEQHGTLLKICDGEAPSRARGTRSLSSLIAHYFAFDHPLAEICASFPDDPAMRTAREFCRGLRIIRQPKWECLAIFICSSMKQVAHIRQISRKLRERFGDRREIAGWTLFTFPTADRLAEASEVELRGCGLGYRAKNLLATAKRVASSDVDLAALDQLADQELRARLCELPGVAAKVANCTMLFAYERLAAFPIDVHIARILREEYFSRRRKVTPKMLDAFAARYFGGQGGYAQQYLFHHARSTRRRS